MSLIISANADAVLAVARSQAIRFGHEFISCDHVLLAILLSNLGGFAPWLEEQGLTLNDLELRLLAIPRPEPRPLHGMPLSPALAQILSGILGSGMNLEPRITIRRLLRGILRRARDDWPAGLSCESLIAAGRAREDLDRSLAALDTMEDTAIREMIERGPQPANCLDP